MFFATAVIVALAISLPIAFFADDSIPTDHHLWSDGLGDPWSGNDRARAYRGLPAPPLQLFPLHKEGETSFIMKHRCAGICRTNHSAACTNERQLSNSIFAQGPDEDIPDPRGLSAMVWGIGQLADHDITKVGQGDDTFCSIPLPDLGPTITPIAIKRTVVEIDSAGCRNPKMQITPYIDGTPFYGDYINPKRAAALREYTLGKLRLTPAGFPMRDPANPREFLAGDVRASENAVLSALHTLFARQHNKMAALVHTKAASWGDEQLYWKARRIVVAQWQKILYEEWLPALMGSFYDQTAFGQDGVAAACESSHGVSGDTLMKTEFAQSVFRFGHSLVTNKVGPYQLKDIFNNPDFLETTGLDPIITAACKTHSQRADAKIVDTMRNILFGQHGMDLVSINIARGREIGVAFYDDVVACYAGAHQSRRDETGSDSLFVRAQQEPLYPGSSLPQQIGVIIASQFLDLCRADPFFYTRASAREHIGEDFFPLVHQATLKSVIVGNTGVPADSLPDNVFYTH